MIRVSLILMLVVCASIFVSIGIIHGQEAEIMGDGATIRGEVIEATPEQKPIRGVTVTILNTGIDEAYTVTTDENGAYEKTGLPPGRYVVTLSKEGYRNWIGRSKVVAAGGEISNRYRIRKKENENIITLFQAHFFTWQSLIIFAITFFVVLIIIQSSLRSRG